MFAKIVIFLVLLLPACGPVHPNRQFHFSYTNNCGTDVYLSVNPLGGPNWLNTTQLQPSPWNDFVTIHSGQVFGEHWDWTPDQIFILTNNTGYVLAHGSDYGDRCELRQD